MKLKYCRQFCLDINPVFGNKIRTEESYNIQAKEVFPYNRMFYHCFTFRVAVESNILKSRDLHIKFPS